MGWTIIVSRNEDFVRRAIDGLRDNINVVGATGPAAARTLLASLNITTIIADASDEVGRHILAALRVSKRDEGKLVMAVDGRNYGFPEGQVEDLSQAIETAIRAA